MQPHPVLPQHYEKPEEKPAFVNNLFDHGAPFYDRVVGWGFFGSGRSYRKWAQKRAGVGPGQKILDAAAGTGLMAQAALELGVKPDDIVCLDPSPGMLAEAKKKFAVRTVVASADAIPFDAEQFDFVTMGYALRHVASLEGTFREYHRVLKKGGRVLILEVTKPRSKFGDWWFQLWFRRIYPWLTRVFTGSRDAEKMMFYYWETMNAVVPPESIIAAMRSAGFIKVRRRVWGRIFSEYTGLKY